MDLRWCCTLDGHVRSACRFAQRASQADFGSLHPERDPTEARKNFVLGQRPPLTVFDHIATRDVTHRLTRFHYSRGASRHRVDLHPARKQPRSARRLAGRICGCPGTAAGSYRKPAAVHRKSQHSSQLNTGAMMKAIRRAIIGAKAAQIDSVYLLTTADALDQVYGCDREVGHTLGKAESAIVIAAVDILKHFQSHVRACVEEFVHINGRPRSVLADLVVNLRQKRHILRAKVNLGSRAYLFSDRFRFNGLSAHASAPQDFRGIFATDGWEYHFQNPHPKFLWLPRRGRLSQSIINRHVVLPPFEVRQDVVVSFLAVFCYGNATSHVLIHDCLDGGIELPINFPLLFLPGTTEKRRPCRGLASNGESTTVGKSATRSLRFRLQHCPVRGRDA